MPASGCAIRAQHIAQPLQTPTYDGSGQAYHPSVFYDRDGWQGYRYWMAMTPLPEALPTFEDPSILVSQDGQDWRVPDGIINPVVPHPPAGWHNADTELVMAPGGALWCYWIETDDTTIWRLRVAASRDGRQWGPHAVMFEGPDLAVISPAVLREDAGFSMWHYTGQRPGRIVYRWAASPGGPWSDAKPCSVNGLPIGVTIWHIGVARGYQTGYIMVAAATDGALYLGCSSDRYTWHFETDPVLRPVKGHWTEREIYRSCLVDRSGKRGYWLYYSGKGPQGACHIGRTQLA